MKTWYTIEKSANGYTVWMNKEGEQSLGSLGVFTAKKKKECVAYCKENNIKVKKQ